MSESTSNGLELELWLWLLLELLLDTLPGLSIEESEESEELLDRVESLLLELEV